MGIVTYEEEIATAIPPAKMFKVFVLDGHNILPKILPQVFKSIEFIEGNGGPGTIRKTTFEEGNEVTYIKDRIEVVDKENFIFNHTTIEAEPWMDILEKVSYETKLVASPHGGSICKNITKYYPKSNGEIDVDQTKAAEEKTTELLKVVIKVVEDYLLANPDT